MPNPEWVEMTITEAIVQLSTEVISRFRAAADLAEDSAMPDILLRSFVRPCLNVTSDLQSFNVAVSRPKALPGLVSTCRR
jgi:hypothetical protein